ncbi:MAG TPA: SDR family NAD(P)-dependent oxidoreductase [Clostridiaceae bacterium]
MSKIAFITGPDRGLGFAMTERLLDKGWKVYAGQYMPQWTELSDLCKKYEGNLILIPLDVSKEESVKKASEMVSETTDIVDLIINNAGIISKTYNKKISMGLDYSEMERVFNVNTLGPLRVVEAFLPLTDKSAMKRLCFVSSESGSINNSNRQDNYGYCMSKAALNMNVMMMFNRLRPEGYTFRLYHPGWVRGYMFGKKSEEGNLEPSEAAIPAITYFLRDRCRDPHDSKRTDEDRLVLRDWLGRELSW